MLRDRDWELVNAYADGELPDESAAELKLRLETEPELLAALEDVRQAQLRLAMLAPPRTTVEPPRPDRLPRAAVTAAAACLAVILALAAAYELAWKPPAWTRAASDFHHQLSDNGYVLPEEAALPVVSTARIGDVPAFDLSSSRLVLVDIQSARRAGRDLVAMHYRGRNGCRLTVVALEALAGDPANLPIRHEGLGKRWTVEHIHFYVLANGMDLGRFKAIATFAEAESRRLGRTEALRAAMDTATQTAQPCV